MAGWGCMSLAEMGSFGKEGLGHKDNNECCFRYIELGMPLGQPGDVQQAVGKVRLEFRREIRTGNIDLRVNCKEIIEPLGAGKITRREWRGRRQKKATSDRTLGNCQA